MKVFEDCCHYRQDVYPSSLVHFITLGGLCELDEYLCLHSFKEASLGDSQISENSVTQ